MILRGVMTVSEAAKQWKVSTAALRKAIKEGRLVATKSGATWLIAFDDMVTAYGQPSKGEKRAIDTG